MASCDIDLFVEDRSWKSKEFSFINEGLLLDIFYKVMEYLKISFSAESIEISVTLTDDENIQKLNREYRKKNKPTNVLTFSLYEKRKNVEEALKKEPCVSLGDIIFSNETLKKEAKEQNKTVENHFKHLLIHSYLHLFGYDHMTKKDEKEMESIEIDILKLMGIENPYII